MNTEPLVIGLDIGGTKIAGGFVDALGRTITSTIPTPATRGSSAILDAAAGLVSQLLETLDGAEVRQLLIGVAAAGAISADGVVLAATDILPDWAGTDLIAGLLDRTRATTVTAVNDVHAAGYGEARVGAASGRSIVLCVAVGTGIGGAVLINGRPLLGRTGSAGSIGHVPSGRSERRVCSCGAHDHVEVYASGPAIEADYRRLSLDPVHLPLQEIAALARDGDSVAVGVIRAAGLELGTAIGGAANLIDPDVIVIGGGAAELGELLLGPLREGILLQTLSGPAGVPVVKAQLGPAAAVVGAGLLARDIHGPSMPDAALPE